MIGLGTIACLLEWASLPNLESGSLLVMIGKGLMATVTKGLSQLWRWSWFWAPFLCHWYKDSHLWPWGRTQHFSLFFSMGRIFGSLAPCSCLTTCLSPSQDTGTKVIGKRAETALASSGWTGVSWSPGSQCLLSVKVHLWKEMRVHEMIKPLVPM